MTDRIISLLLLLTMLSPLSSESQNFYRKYIRSQDIFSYLENRTAKMSGLTIDTIRLFGNNNVSPDIYSYDSRKKFADYLFYTKQYKSSATEYHEILKNQYSLPIAMDYEKALLFGGDLDVAEDFCDSISGPFSVKVYNIKSCIYVMTDNFTAFDTLNKDLLLPSIVVIRNIPVKYKSVPLAATMSAIVPGAGQIYSGNASQGVVTAIVAALDAVHIAYGVRKYGVRNAYPILSIGFGAGFYVSNILHTVRLTRQTNSNIKNYRNEKLLDYMSTVLF